VVDPLDLADRAFQRQVKLIAHGGDKPVFDFDLTKDTQTTSSSLTIVQGNWDDWRGKRDLVALDIQANGTITILANVSGLEQLDEHGSDLADSSVLFTAYVRQRLQQAWSFAAREWDHVDPSLRHATLLYNALLYDVADRVLDEGPPGPKNRVNHSNRRLSDPLGIYDVPRRISRQDLREPDEEIRRTVDMLRLRFRERDRG